MSTGRVGYSSSLVLYYFIHGINICLVPILISVRYPLCRYLHNFLISLDIHGYPRVFTKKGKNKYLATYFNCKFI